MGEYIPFFNATNNKGAFSMCSVGIVFKNPDHCTSSKNRPDTALEYVVSGKGFIRYNNREYETTAGDFLFFPRGCEYECISDRDDPWVKISIVTNGRLIQNIMRSYFPCDVPIFADSPYCYPYFKKLIKMFKDNPPLTPALDTDASLVIHELIAEHYNKSQEVDRSATEKLRLDAYAVKTYIDNNFRNTIHVSDLSELIFRCNSQTIRIFKKVYGMAPYDYIMNLRITSAQQLLEQTNIPVKDIAFSLGFTNEHYFSTLFKTKTGLTPSKYRKNTFHKK